jgi:hypothetical protein
MKRLWPIIPAALLLSGCMGTPSQTAIMKDNHIAIVANPTATLAENHAALKTAKNECVILEARIKAVKQDKLKTAFAWLAGGFGVLAALCAIGAWYLKSKKFIKGVMLCGVAACVCGVLIKLVPYFGAISIGVTFVLALAAAWYLSKHTNDVHARICKAQR